VTRDAVRDTLPPTRTLVMTGATRGFGKVAAIELLRGSPDVHLAVVCRTDGPAVAEELRRRSGNPNVSAAIADLSSMASAQAAAAELRAELESESLPRLAGFVGNAGVQMTSAATKTVDGLETTFAVNVVANHLVVNELRDHFGAPARIVLTTSDTHFGDFRHTFGTVPAPRWVEPERLAAGNAFDSAGSAAAGRAAYSTSKLAVIYLVHALARRLPESVDVFSFNPGLVPGTGLARDAGAIRRFAFRWLMPAMTITPLAHRPRVAGRRLADAAIGPLDAPSGAYINGTRAERSSAESYDPEREAALWGWLEETTVGA
jgi:NAD(P)-dependent dehydrogenase (short-subunit alcohol dehydrogenase family)